MASKRPSVKTKKPKERWLLTRKTWRYMADAGRRLVPEGTSNTEEDVPVIEAHFQEVCKRETRFLLWRKCSYPSALRQSKSNRKHIEKGLKNRAGSATELELGPVFSRLRDNKGRNSLPGASRHAQKGGSKCSSNEGSGADEPRSTERLIGSPRRARRSVRRRGGYAGVGATCVAGGDGSLIRRDVGSEDEVENLAFEEEEDDHDFVKSHHETSRNTEDTSYGGVKKKISQFWRGTSDTAKQSGSVRSKSRSSVKTSKASNEEEEENINKSDWHKLKNATSESDFDKCLKLENSHKSSSLRKVSSTEHTDSTGRHLRYGIGNIPKTNISREKVKLKHIEQNIGNVSFERSISADQRTSFHNLHDSKDYFDEEAESNWGLERSSSFKDKHHTSIIDHKLTASSRGGSHSVGYIASSPNLPSRHNLTLPGLNISRPSRTHHHHTDVNLTTSTNFTSNLQHHTRTRRSGKIENDFYSFQNHLTQWKPTTNTDISEISKTDNNSTTQQQVPSVTKPPVGRQISIKGPKFYDQGTQTLQISNNVMRVIESEIRNSETISPQPSPTPPNKNSIRRKSSSESTRGTANSVTEDCSPSVGDTILRYLRMARKKSVDGDKSDRFKSVNYDRRLRYIKSKGPVEDENIKNIQTDESWLNLSTDPNLFDEYYIDNNEHNNNANIGQVDDLHLFCSDQESSDLGFASSSRAASSRSSFDAGELTIPVPTYPTSPQSPNSPSSGHSFLAQLLHGLQQAAGNPHMSLPAAMQKSKSSSSVGHHAPRLMAKKIWRTRSKSQSRASTTSTWTPQGQCRWTSVTGRSVSLQPTSLLHLSELERRVLQQVALAKLQALNLGVQIRIPSEEPVAAPKPKRRAYLLKRKALTTGFFDSGRKEGDKDKEGSSGGLVFGIPLSQCITNDRLSEEARGVGTSGGSPAELRRRSHHGSRSSFSSLGDAASRAEQGGSCESLPAGAGSGRVAGSVPGLLDVLSLSEEEAWSCSPSVPHLVSTCCRHIMQHGLHTLGIFRVSSSKKRVRQLREDFDCGRDTEFSSELCPHDAATLLKEFFRDLPDPLMCRELYPAFINTQRIRNRRLQLEAMQHLIQLLPVPNRDTLAALLAFLNTVAKHSADRRDAAGEWLVGNKMDSTNLATLFAPNILHCFRANAGAKEAAAERAEDRTDAINVTRSLIDHHGEVFEVSAELLDEVFLHMMDSHPDNLDQVLRKLCFGGDDMADDGDNNSVFEGSESSSVPRTPTEGLVTPISAVLDDKDSRGWSDSSRKVWSREEFLHETAGMGGPDVGMSPRHRGRERSKKRGKEDSAEGGSTRWFSHHQSGSKKREKSSSDEGRRRSERGSTSSGCAEPVTPLSSPPAPSFPCSRSPSLDDSQASTIVGSHRNDGTGNVITASLKIPVPASSFALSLDDIPYIEDERGGVLSPGRRSIDSNPTTYTARPSTDSAIGSTMSPAPGSEPPVSSPSGPASPTPENEPTGVTGRILIPALSTKVTGGSVLRRVESSTKVSEVERRPSTKVLKEDKKKYTRRRYTDSRHPTTNFPDVEALEAASTSDSSKPSQVWKRRELIASDPKDHETFV